MQSTQSGEQPSLEGDTSFDGNTSPQPVTPPRPKDNGPKMGSTPITNHRAVSSELNAIPEELESRMAGFHAEITGHVVGPIDVEHFNEFLPVAQSTGTGPDGMSAYQKLASELNTAKNEGGMYEALVEYLNELRPSENIRFCDKHHKVLRVFDGVDIKPDIMVFHGNDEATIEAMFEVKYNDDDDPFDDNLPSFQRESINSKKTLGQITSYATCHQALEFRTHAFSALIFRKYMRLLRWDRSGVVVTKKILLNDRSLFDFFRRFTSATPVQRGRDPTVTAYLSGQMEDIRRLLECDEKAPLLAISIGNNEYILKDQPPGSTSPIGRSTRCFKAYDSQKKQVVLLKDSWRVVSPTLKPEHKIYAKLHERKVQNVPEVYHGSDIGDENDPHHTTQTKLWFDKTKMFDKTFDKTAKSFKLTFRTHRHYRIVLEYLPYSLEDFEITPEMIAIVRDASLAHCDAAIEARVVHRDISNGNIMFKRKEDGTVQGYLIDWDLSLDLDLADQNSVEAQPERTGTWQFLAIRLLEPSKIPVIQNRIDDVESFYHLILWMALRYTCHILDAADLTVQLHHNFDARYRNPETGEHIMATARIPNMDAGVLFRQAKFANGGIKDVLQAMQQVLRERYTEPEIDFRISQEKERTEAIAKKESALKTLEDPRWLPDLLSTCLQDERNDWKTNAERVKHELAKFPNKFGPIGVK